MREEERRTSQAVARPVLVRRQRTELDFDGPLSLLRDGGAPFPVRHLCVWWVSQLSG